MPSNLHLLRFPRQTALAANLTLVLMGADIIPAVATTRTVTNCLDGISVPGSLRAAVAAANQANTSDTVEFDMAQMQCSRITLTEGALGVSSANDLTLNGPGAAQLILDGGNGVGPVHDRVLTHTGTGTLTLNGLTISNGVIQAVNGPANGGCVAGKIIRITNSVVSGCLAESSASYAARGGGIYAEQNIELINSTVSGNTVRSGNGNARGGGIFSGFSATNNMLRITDSSIRNNVSEATGTGHTYGGGVAAVYTYGDASIVSSTISGNQAENGGGLSLYMTHGFIKNSTVSGNRSSGSGGGVHAYVSGTQIANSTIAGNITEAPFSVGGVFATSDSVLLISSSIIANNKAADTPSDLNDNANIDANSSGQNLIFATAAMVPDTLKNTCPELEPLADNGGPTQTHALHSTSPAIGQGNNWLTYLFDQRGANFSRQFGAAVDIGAYEWQGGPDEQIFHSGFESGCDE